MRQNNIRQPTRALSQAAINAVTAEVDNKPTDSTTNMEKKDNQFGKKMIVHYTHEKRFNCFKGDMHQILDDTFQKQIDKDIKLIVGNRNRQNAQKELVHKRPKQRLLTNKIQKSKLLSFIHINIFDKFLIEFFLSIN